MDSKNLNDIKKEDKEKKGFQPSLWEPLWQ